MKVISEIKEKEEEDPKIKYQSLALLKRGWKVYVNMINNTKISTLIPIIRQKVQPDSIVYSDYYHSYYILDVSEFKHFRINHSKKFSQEKNHINGIDNFWNQAKKHLLKCNGIPKEHFHLLKNVNSALIIQKLKNN